jgi:tetrahydromethanopterin S-methyltransferase subunit C
LSDTASDRRADRIAVHATGVGIGLMGFMVTWIIAARITGRILDSPTSAYVAMVVALVIGAVVTILASRRLGRTDQYLNRS